MDSKRNLACVLCIQSLGHSQLGYSSHRKMNALTACVWVCLIVFYHILSHAAARKKQTVLTNNVLLVCGRFHKTNFNRRGKATDKVRPRLSWEIVSRDTANQSLCIVCTVLWFFISIFSSPHAAQVVYTYTFFPLKNKKEDLSSRPQCLYIFVARCFVSCPPPVKCPMQYIWMGQLVYYT